MFTLSELLSTVLFELAGTEITILKVSLFAVVLIVSYIISKYVLVRLFDELLEGLGFDEDDRSSFLRVVYFLLMLIGVYIGLNVLSIKITLVLTTVLFSFAGAKVTLLGIVLLVLSIVLSYVISKFLITKSLNSILREGGISEDNRASVLRLIHYFVIFLGIYIGFNIIGIQFTSLLAVAGITGIILGFGLQPIIANLISGFLLMGERTVKVGDWVEFDGTYGLVVDTGIRASTIRNIDNVHTLIPNRTFVESPFTNYSHKDRKIRITVSVGVAYGSDVEKVKEILLQIAGENGKVLEKPEPDVFFNEFGDSSLKFELKCWIRDPSQRKAVRSEINFEIDRRFAEEEVVIPFPQRDVWIKDSKNTNMK